MYKKQSMIVLSLVSIGLILCASITLFFDPFFHYHQPQESLEYYLYNQRYQNYGIARHFEYDMVITGTSMTENFRSTQVDELFSAQSIKTPFSGARYREINEFLVVALENNENITQIFRSIDTFVILEPKDSLRYEDYPTYLYDENYLNDGSYLVNKEILFTDIRSLIHRNLQNEPSTTFDEYANWMSLFDFSEQATLQSYTREVRQENNGALTEAERREVQQTVEQNLLQIAKDNPDVTFTYFFPPYSILYFDFLRQTGDLEKTLQAIAYAAELMVAQENIHLFSFFLEKELVCNLNLYKDMLHYCEDVNTQIVQWVQEDTHRLTRENIHEHFAEMETFYMAYDYDTLFV